MYSLQYTKGRFEILCVMFLKIFCYQFRGAFKPNSSAILYDKTPMYNNIQQYCIQANVVIIFLTVPAWLLNNLAVKEEFFMAWCETWANFAHFWSIYFCNSALIRDDNNCILLWKIHGNVIDSVYGDLCHTVRKHTYVCELITYIWGVELKPCHF
jgi:hypothetical protein